MKIIIKNINSEFIKSISLKELNPLDKNFLKFISIKEPLEANIFAINETINVNQLAKFKINIKKLNVNSIHIFSNIRESIISGKSLKINSTFVNEKDLKKLFLNSTKKQEDILHKGTIRSGDRISSNGHLYIIGDVNPGAIVSAKKNVYVWGKLLGIALAGEGGNKNASIASLYLKPLQLRISEVIAIGPKKKPKNYYPEIAVLEKQTILIKPYLMDN
tara:strand:- start:69 stop:722 length:654 start_codon:yes stop_codon:yes gene_type:complete